MRLPGRLGKLKLLTPPGIDPLLERMDTDADDAEDRIPYWAEAWPSSEALIRFLLSPRAPRRPGPALELGSGLGLAGMAALRLGWDLQLSDFHEDAVALLRGNLARNGWPADRALRLDWRRPPPSRWRSIIASDVLYERPFAPALAVFLEDALLPGGRAWIAEPGRPIAEEGIALLAERFRLRTHASRSRVEGRWRPVRILELSIR